VTPIAWMWTLSTAGALLFFAAGMLARRSPRAAGAGSDYVRRLEADRALLADEVARLARERPGPATSNAAPTGPVPVMDRESSVELDRLRRRAADMDEITRENDSLRQAAGAADALKARVAELEREVDFLRHEQLTARVSRPVPARVPRRAPTAPSALDSLLVELQQGPGVTGGVIADDLGLLVAGDHQTGVTLAAVGGYLHGVGNRMREFLGFGPATRILVEDDTGSSVTATPMPGASAQLVAVVVTGSWRRSD
jgi:predicted regulator of Ras-like GTPase activity (Roadblock/LC7/MglB family)